MHPNRTSSLGLARTFRFLALILGVTFLAHLPIIASPGYYNHDEWQISDELQEFGLTGYLERHFRIPETPSFGVPVRPIARAMNISVMYAAPDMPFLVHSFDVMLHALVACSVFLFLARGGLSPNASVASALVFAICPATTMSVSWTGAYYDRVYTLFTLWSLYFVREILFSFELRWRDLYHCCGAFFFAGLAIGSKETAIMLPVAAFAMVSYYWYKEPSLRKWSHSLVALAVIATPIAIYLGLRIDALLGSLAGDPNSPYRMSLGNLPSNYMAYFAHPFSWWLLEAAVSLRDSNILWGASFHCLLLAVICWRFGVVSLFTYLFAFTIFLLPVLPLPYPGSHYLYASALPISVAVGLLLTQPIRLSVVSVQQMVSVFTQPSFHCRTVGIGLVLLFLIHMTSMQFEMYNIGFLQRQMLSSLETHLDAMSEEEKQMPIFVSTDPGRQRSVMQCALFGRQYCGPYKNIQFVFEMPETQKSISLRWDEPGVFRRLPEPENVAAKPSTSHH